MPACDVTITLEQPLLITSNLNDPNSVVSYDYIPGSSIRGLFAEQYMRCHGLANGRDDKTATFEQLFLSGAVRFLNAYPVQDSLRSMPIPLPSRPRKQKELAFGLPRRGSIPEQVEVLHSVAVHVQRDPVKGRAWIKREAKKTAVPYGTVFRYEALAAGQIFRALLVYDTPVTDSAVQNAIHSGYAQLGRSRSAGYGRVQVEIGTSQSTWSELPGSEQSPHGYNTITLLSDCLLRGSSGSDCIDLTDAVLSAYLGVPVTLVPDLCRMKTTIVGGFNRIWETPLPDRHALAMGSVIVLQVAAGHTLPWQQLENDGIGDRRIDGYGRVALNWIMPGSSTGNQSQPTQDAEELDPWKALPQIWLRTYSLPGAQEPPEQTPLQQTPGNTQTSTTTTLNSAEQLLLQRVLQRYQEPRVQQAISDFVQRQIWPQIDRDSNNWPSNSMLARLRNSVRRAQATNDLNRVLQEFQSFRQPARQAYERAHFFERGQLSKWIEQILGSPDTIWQMDLLNVPYAPDRTEQYTRQTALQLLAAVLAAPVRYRLAHADGKEQGRG